MRRSAQLHIISYDDEKITRGYNAIKSKINKLEIELEKSQPSKVKLTKNSPPIWGCIGTELKQCTLSLNGSINDLAELTTIKTIEGVYIRLLVSKK